MQQHTCVVNNMSICTCVCLYIRIICLGQGYSSQRLRKIFLCLIGVVPSIPVTKSSMTQAPTYLTLRSSLLGSLCWVPVLDAHGSIWKGNTPSLIVLHRRSLIGWITTLRFEIVDLSSWSKSTPS